MNKRYNERILAENISVSNDSYKTGLNGHDLVIGGSGAGKTTGYVCPNLNHPDGSIVIQDTKGKLYQKYHKSLEDKGYKVYLLDFVNPEKSYGYNPLEFIRQREDGSYYEMDIKKLATTLMPILDSDEPFWEKAAIRYISMLISYVLDCLPFDEHNLSAVVRMHQEYQAGYGKDMLSLFADEKPNSYAARKFKMISNSFIADKMWMSIMEFSNEALDPFDCKEFENIFKNPKTIDMKSIGEEKTAVFLNIPDNDKSYGILCDIFNTQLLQVLIDEADKRPDGRLKMPVRLYLDDFAAAAGQIPEFDTAMSVLRSRDISVSIMLQSISQLNSIYGSNKAKTIINNCDHILYLGGDHDLETAEFIGHHINMTPHTILSLPLDKAVLLTRGEKYQIVNKIKPKDGLAIAKSSKDNSLSIA